MRSCISRELAVSGGCCRRTFPRLPPCKVISTIGETTACLRRSILHCCCKRANRRAARRARHRDGGHDCNLAADRPPLDIGRRQFGHRQGPGQPRGIGRSIPRSSTPNAQIRSEDSRDLILVVLEISKVRVAILSPLPRLGYREWNRRVCHGENSHLITTIHHIKSEHLASSAALCFTSARYNYLQLIWLIDARG